MPPITLTHIVPALNPQIDGVGDYALNLARHLRDSHEIHARFIVCDPQWDGPSRIEGFVVRRLRLQNEAGVWSMLNQTKETPSTALLHYSCHGYAGHGIPFWLYQGLRSWLAEGMKGTQENNRQLLTVFHQLSSSEVSLSASFFLRFFQDWVIEQLHRQSKVSVVSTKRMQDLLDNLEPNKTLCLPVPSNIPVVALRPEGGSDARLRVAIFGQKHHRTAAVKAHANLLKTLDRKNLLASAVVMGKGLTSAASAEEVKILQRSVARERIEVAGELSPEAISQKLARSDMFVSFRTGDEACISGAVMAALAAGCPAVLRAGRGATPLRENEHFVASDDSPSSVKRLEKLAVSGDLLRVAEAGRQWYAQNADWKVVASQYHKVLSQETFRPRGGSGLTRKAAADLPVVPGAPLFPRVSLG